jgi:hypothetical protein
MTRQRWPSRFAADFGVPISVAGHLATGDRPQTMPTSPPQVPYAAGDPAAHRHSRHVGMTGARWI